jgi:drug/metabolite transporter (DMT)-like permease
VARNEGTEPAGPSCPSETASRRAGVRLAILATGLFSTSAILVRLASGLGPLEVASYRLILGAGFVAVMAAVGRKGLGLWGAVNCPDRQGSGRHDGRRDRLRRGLPILAAGLAAAAHFAFYIGSLYRTTIAHALVLVNLSPVLAIPLSAIFLGEKLKARRLPGVFIVMVGLGIMVGLEPGLTRAQLAGDILALLAALAYAVYSLIGRSQRTKTNLLAYTFWVYLMAGLILLPAALGSRGLLPGLGPVGGVGAGGSPVAASTVLAVILLALLPTAGGHTLYNAALRRTDAVTINLIATQEVTGGVLLGLLLLGEAPSIQTVVGGVVALVGLLLVLARTGDHPAPSGRAPSGVSPGQVQ